MSPGICNFCGKGCPQYCNYCDWGCHVGAAKADGGEIHAPNGLPVGCVKADGSMWECEHGDHPDYKFPVVAEFIPTSDDVGDPEDDEHDERTETHALLYNDEYIALTIYEYCYSMWSLSDGKLMHGPSWYKNWHKNWRLTEKSIKDIKAGKYEV